MIELLIDGWMAFVISIAFGVPIVSIFWVR